MTLMNYSWLLHWAICMYKFKNCRAATLTKLQFQKQRYSCPVYQFGSFDWESDINENDYKYKNQGMATIYRIYNRTPIPLKTAKPDRQCLVITLQKSDRFTPLWQKHRRQYLLNCSQVSYLQSSLFRLRKAYRNALPYWCLGNDKSELFLAVPW